MVNPQYEEALQNDKFGVIRFYLNGNKLFASGCMVIIAGKDESEFFINKDKGLSKHKFLINDYLNVASTDGKELGESVASRGYLLFTLSTLAVSTAYIPDELSDFQLQVIEEYIKELKDYNSLPGIIPNDTFVKPSEKVIEEYQIDESFSIPEERHTGLEGLIIQEFYEMINNKKRGR